MRRGRFAPSPTGALHLGNARSFLLAWLSIRQAGGELVLRMEDLEHPRVKPGAAAAVLEDLKWLGLDWDEGPDCGGPCGPYVQSQRRPHYREALRQLRRDGWVYPCSCSRADVEAAQRAPHLREEHVIRYEGHCRGRYADWSEAVAALPSGRLPVWRFRTPTGDVAFEDGICGRCVIDPSEKMGDFALARDEDGAGYTLAVVVDDAAMGITEVLRGDDLLDATPNQILIQRALGLPTPQYLHVPLVVAEDGHRLAKRHGDTRLCALRELGVTAPEVVGLLAWWSGWAVWGECLMPRDLLSRMDWRTFRREPAVLTSKVKEFLAR